MQFAVNYSTPLIRLIQAKKIKIDLIKCPDWEGMLAEAAPYGNITIHFDLNIGLGKTNNVDFDRLKWFKEQTFTPHINTHMIAPRNFDINNEDEREKINTLWRREINLLIDNFGASCVVLEHFPYTNTTPHLQYATDNKIFSKVIEDTGCMLLLDLAHARITAKTLEIDVKDYIMNLPLDRLSEMHITGIQKHNGVLTDHFGLDRQDWEIFTWALDQIKKGIWRKPEIVAFEYGGIGEVFAWRTDINVLQTQVPLLYQAVHQPEIIPHPLD